MIKPLGDIPRGVEVLVKKAAVDAAFREALLRERGGAAARIGLALEPAEQAMLAAIPARQLEQVIAGTRVPAPLRAAFMGYAAAAMLAVMGTNSGCSHKDKHPVIETKTRESGLEGDGAISGIVHNSAGDPIAGARVCDDKTGNYFITNSGGRFRLRVAAQNDAKFTISCKDYGYCYLSGVVIKPGENSYFEITLSTTKDDPYLPPSTGLRPDEIPPPEEPESFDEYNEQEQPRTTSPPNKPTHPEQNNKNENAKR